MSAGDHRRWEDDLAAWVLGALDGSEANRFERHLARCERCRSDLRWLRPAVDAIPASVTQVAPPPRLRGRLLGVARTEARRAEAQGRPARRLLPRIALPRPALAALGAAALAAAGVAGYALRGEPDSTTVELRASREAPKASAELVVRDGTGTLRASDMPRLERGQVFQAWIREGDAIEPSTTFVRGRGGTATATLPGVGDADQVMVTREARGGSKRPTTAPLLRAEL